MSTFITILDADGKKGFNFEKKIQRSFRWLSVAGEIIGKQLILGQWEKEWDRRWASWRLDG